MIQTYTRSRMVAFIVSLSLILASAGNLFAQAPANDNLCNAVSLTVDASCNGVPNGDNTNSTAQAGEPLASCYVGGPNSVWYSFVAPASGLVTITTDFLIGTNDDTEIALYSLPGGNCNSPATLVELGCSQDIDFFNFLSTIPTTPVTPGATYYVSVSGWQGTEGTFCVVVNSIVSPANDSLCNATALTVGAGCAGSPNGDNTGSLAEAGEPVASCFVGGTNSVWYSFVGPASGYVSVSTDFLVGTNGDTEIAIYELPGGNCANPSSLVELACDQDGGTTVNFNSVISSAPVTPGNTYYVSVSGWNGTEGSFCIEVTESIPPVNDSLCNAVQLTLGAGCIGTNGTTQDATLETNEDPASCGGSSNTVWYWFIAPSSGFVNVSTDTTGVGGTNAATDVALFALPGNDCSAPGTLFEIDCASGNTTSGSSLDSVAVNPGDTIYVQVSGGAGTFCVAADAVTPALLPPANDSLCNAIALVVDGGCNPLAPNGDNTLSTDEIGEPAGSCFAGGANSVWYSFVAPASGYVDITTDIIIDTVNFIPNEDTEIAIYELPGGNCANPSTLVELDCDQDGGQVIQFNSIIANVAVTPGTTYYVQVSGWNGEEGAFCLEVNSSTGITNDDACDAILLPVDGTFTTGTTIGATVQTGESVIEQPAVGGAGNDGWNEGVIDASVWYKFVAPASGSVEVDMCGNGLAGTTYDSQVAVYGTTDCANFNTYSFFGGNDDLIGCPSVFASFLTVSCLTPGDTFYIIVDGWDGDEGNFGISITEVTVDPMSVNGITLDPACPGDNDGAISVFANGGGGFYEYVWNTGATTNLITGLTAGTYTVAVTDLCDSVLTQSFTIGGGSSGLVADAGRDTAICEGSTLVLGADEPGSGGLPQLGEAAFGADLGNQVLVKHKLNDPANPVAVGTSLTGAMFAGDLAFGIFFMINDNSQQLVAVDTSTGIGTVIGASTPTTGHTWTGLAFDGTTNIMYATSTDGSVSTFYTIDLGTGTANPVATMNLALPIWIAIDNNGNCYTMDIATDMLYSVNKTTGQATEIGPTGFNANFAQDADFDPETNQLYAVAWGNGFGPELRRFDVSTGLSILIGEITGTAVIAFTIAEDTETPYTYSWSPALGIVNPFVSNPTATPPVTTNYILSVLDECFTIATDTVTVTVGDAPSVAPSSTPDNGSGNGTASANATGGTSPYTYVWSNGSTTDIITGLDSGVYVVTVTDALGCTDTDSIEVGSNVGIDHLLSAGINLISVYPNPSEGLFNVEVELAKFDELEITIFDMKGEQVFGVSSNRAIKFEQQINLSNLASGVYMLNVTTSQGTASKRITLR
ncbi:MAG: T9SS type A sorting domain-containing protein [Bacteroidia bacterium]|nr:T9SS type A sorting domain-containing protein [Bacteroidia bacterium]